MSIVYPCVYCTDDGCCNKYSDDSVTSWCVQSPCEDEKPSNADRIRAMRDEELAEHLFRHICNWSCPPKKEYIKDSCGGEKPDCENCWLEWLREEATE